MRGIALAKAIFTIWLRIFLIDYRLYFSIKNQMNRMTIFRFLAEKTTQECTNMCDVIM